MADGQQTTPSVLPQARVIWDDLGPRLRRNVAGIGFALTLMLLVIGGWIGFVNVKRLADHNQWVTHTHEVISSLDELLATFRNSEIGVRGYMLVEDAKYLKPYQEALLHVGNDVAVLNDLIADNPDQQANVAILEQKIAVRLELSKQTIALMMRDDRPAALKLISSDIGKDAIDDLLQHIAAMKHLEYDLLRQRTEQSVVSYRRALWSILIQAILGVVLLAVVFWLSQRNITQAERAAALLTEQKERLRTTLASIGDGVITTDMAARIINMNAVAESLTGWTNNDAIGQPLDAVFRIVHEETRQSIANPAMRALKEGVVVELANHTVLVSRDETERVIDDSAAPIRCKLGEIVGCVLVFRDVTDKRKAELRLSQIEEHVLKDTKNKLLESESQLRELAMHIKLALWVIDPIKDRVIYISPGYEKIWGRSCQSLIERRSSFLEGVHPLDQEMMIHADAIMIESGHIDVECRILRPDGSVRWVSLRGYAVRNDHGEAVRVVRIVEDITEAKVSQEGLAKLAAIVECSDDAIVSCNQDGIIATWNDGAERLYGYPAAEMIGQNMRLLYSPEDPGEYEQSMESVQMGERIASYDTKRLRKDGTSIAVSVSLSPITAKNQMIVGACNIAHDITKLTQLQHQYRQSQKMEAVGTLAGGVAHDFNNLLTIISGYTELMLTNMLPTDPKREPLEAILDAGERAASLTRQLLAFSRKTVLEPKILDLNVAVKETETMLQRLIGEHIHLGFVPDPGIRPIKVDPGLLGQVLMNLAVNARDAMPQGGKLTIETRNTELDLAFCQVHPGAKPGRFVELSVSDTGYGMTPELVSHIFEPFFTTKGVGQGTGLGLAVVYGIIKQSEGYIEVSSEPGAGTRFKIYFPSLERQPDRHSVDGLAPSVRKGIETVLVVEDEESVRGIVLLALKTQGYMVLTARDGNDALRVVAKHVGNIDLLVSDVVMPGISGREIADKLGTMYPGMKTLFISGYTDDAIIRNGLVQDEIAFLSKPFSLQALAKKVGELLDGPQESHVKGTKPSQ